MEDAQIKAGNGLVKREATTTQESMSTADYFKAKRALAQGTQENAELQRTLKSQSGLRKILDGKVRKLVQEDMRYR